MEQFKDFNEIIEPDVRNGFVKYDLKKSTSIKVTQKEIYNIIEKNSLSSTVPEDVKSYFNTIRNLCIYAWYYYPFYTTANFLFSTAIEMALRIKFNDKETAFKNLIKKAIKQGLIRNEEFYHEDSKENNSIDFIEILKETIPYLRNSAAHSEYNAIIPPNYTLEMLKITTNLINQIFSKD